MTPGLANKLCFSSASKICCNFPETLSKLPKGKAVLSGTPIRDEIFTGDREKGLALCGFTPDLPVIMIMGGSQGALAVNEAVRAHLDELLQDFQIIHLCGAGKLDESLQDRKGYKQFEYVKEDLRHLFAATDLIISRSGANAICEILALKIPNILVPLAVGSRGDQVLNAESFVSQGFSVLVPTDELNARIVDTVHQVYKDRAKYKEAMEKSSQGSAIPVIMDLIKNAGKGC
jgi:UDP-N-acetylglucosamine--N-acetylmuramyl-(pentapeptide) pyrophosphoryl-undecaprenol N-acetylglucosamine transferase